MLSDEERTDLIRYRIEKAYRVLQEAKDNARLGHWELTGNRLYYSIFHIAQALLLSKGLSAHTHSGMIHVIGSHFIQSGILDKKDGRLISQLFELRQFGDYNDMYGATEEEIMPYFDKVVSLMKRMENLIEE